MERGHLARNGRSRVRTRPLPQAVLTGAGRDAALRLYFSYFSIVPLPPTAQIAFLSANSP